MTSPPLEEKRGAGLGLQAKEQGARLDVEVWVEARVWGCVGRAQVTSWLSAGREKAANVLKEGRKVQPAGVWRGNSLSRYKTIL